VVIVAFRREVRLGQLAAPQGEGKLAQPGPGVRRRRAEGSTHAFDEPGQEAGPRLAPGRMGAGLCRSHRRAA
jgi:hypothetical protein